MTPWTWETFAVCMNRAVEYVQQVPYQTIFENSLCRKDFNQQLYDVAFAFWLAIFIAVSLRKKVNLSFIGFCLSIAFVSFEASILLQLVAYLDVSAFFNVIVHEARDSLRRITVSVYLIATIGWLGNILSVLWKKFVAIFSNQIVYESATDVLRHQHNLSQMKNDLFLKYKLELKDLIYVGECVLSSVFVYGFYDTKQGRLFSFEADGKWCMINIDTFYALFVLVPKENRNRKASVFVRSHFPDYVCTDTATESFIYYKTFH